MPTASIVLLVLDSARTRRLCEVLETRPRHVHLVLAATQAVLAGVESTLPRVDTFVVGVSCSDALNQAISAPVGDVVILIDDELEVSLDLVLAAIHSLALHSAAVARCMTVAARLTSMSPSWLLQTRFGFAAFGSSLPWPSRPTGLPPHYGLGFVARSIALRLSRFPPGYDAAGWPPTIGAQSVLEQMTRSGEVDVDGSLATTRVVPPMRATLPAQFDYAFWLGREQVRQSSALTLGTQYRLPPRQTLYATQYFDKGFGVNQHLGQAAELAHLKRMLEARTAMLLARALAIPSDKGLHGRAARAWLASGSAWFSGGTGNVAEREP